MLIRRVDAGDRDSRERGHGLSEGAGQALSIESASPETLFGEPRSRWLAALVLFATASLLTRLPFLRAGFVNVDEAAHLVGSWELMRGGRLYLDFADNKPPLVYLFYAGAQELFGRGIFAVRLLAAVALIPLIALGASAFFGHGRRGMAAALAFVVTSATMLASDAHAVHCEHIMLLPLAWSLVVLRSPRALLRPGALFLAGALVGLATLGKQPAALCLAVPGLGVVGACFLRAQGPGRPRGGVRGARRVAVLWGALLAGFALPLAACAALFAREGTLASAFFWIWRYNLTHIDNPMPLADKALRVLTMGALTLPATVPLVVGACLRRGVPRCGHRRSMPILLALCTFFPALLGLRLFGHYFLPLLFALSLAAAPFLAVKRASAPRVALVAFAVLALVAFTGVSRVVFAREGGVADVSRPAYEHIGEALRADGQCPGGALFVWGYAPTVYAYAGGRPASRFVVPIDSLTGYLAGNDAAEQGRIDTRGRIDQRHWAQLMADLARRRPAYVVDTAPANLNRWGQFSMERFPQLRDFVERDYEAFAIVDGAVLYRRNECARGSIASVR